MEKLQPGRVRDGIVRFLREHDSIEGVAYEEIAAHLDEELGKPVARSSVRSYLNLNTPGKFERVGRGRYRLDSASRA